MSEIPAKLKGLLVGVGAGAALGAIMNRHSHDLGISPPPPSPHMSSAGSMLGALAGGAAGYSSGYFSKVEYYKGGYGTNSDPLNLNISYPEESNITVQDNSLITGDPMPNNVDPALAETIVPPSIEFQKWIETVIGPAKEKPPAPVEEVPVVAEAVPQKLGRKVILD